MEKIIIRLVIAYVLATECIDTHLSLSSPLPSSAGSSPLCVSSLAVDGVCPARRAGVVLFINLKRLSFAQPTKRCSIAFLYSCINLWRAKASLILMYDIIFHRLLVVLELAVAVAECFSTVPLIASDYRARNEQFHQSEIMNRTADDGNRRRYGHFISVGFVK